MLCVDDEPSVLTTFRYAMSERFSVLTVGSGADALEILRQRDIAVLLADQRMPGMTGVDLCAQARRLRPDLVRILVTAYADIGDAIDAINRAQVARYVSKPWDDAELGHVLETAIEFVHAQRRLRDIEAKLLAGAPSQVAASIGEDILHEIRNPLEALTLNTNETARFLQSAFEAMPAGGAREARTSLDRAIVGHRGTVTAVKHLAALCDRLGTSLGGDAFTEPMVCDMADVVQATASLLRPQIEQVGALDVSIEATPLVRVPASMVGQITLNLLLNAAQALQGDRRGARSIHVRVSTEGDDALLVVADDGPGIPPEQLEGIFEPRFTTRAGGTGLGLSIVRDLVRRVGGRISVASELNEGTSFEVWLPRA